MTHHPTFEQYMSVDNPHLSNDQLIRKWSGVGSGRLPRLQGHRSMLVESIPDDPAEVDRLIEVTLRDIERGSFDRRSRIEHRPEANTARKPEPEPKGPLGLRLELWWMRVRLWWMVVRLDGARDALREAT
jgi:hypothetical protein